MHEGRRVRRCICLCASGWGVRRARFRARVGKGPFGYELSEWACRLSTQHGPGGPQGGTGDLGAGPRVRARVCMCACACTWGWGHRSPAWSAGDAVSATGGRARCVCPGTCACLCSFHEPPVCACCMSMLHSPLQKRAAWPRCVNLSSGPRLCLLVMCLTKSCLSSLYHVSD